MRQNTRRQDPDAQDQPRLRPLRHPPTPRIDTPLDIRLSSRRVSLSLEHFRFQAADAHVHDEDCGREGPNDDATHENTLRRLRHHRAPQQHPVRRRARHGVVGDVQHRLESRVTLADVRSRASHRATEWRERERVCRHRAVRPRHERDRLRRGERVPQRRRVQHRTRVCGPRSPPWLRHSDKRHRDRSATERTPPSRLELVRDACFRILWRTNAVCHVKKKEFCASRLSGVAREMRRHEARARRADIQDHATHVDIGIM